MSRPCHTIAAAALAALLLALAAAPATADPAGLTLSVDAPLPWLDPLVLAWEEDGLRLQALSVHGEIWGYELRAGMMPVAWGPSPFENLLFGDGPGLPLVWLAADYDGFEILPAMHYENFYAALPPRGGSDRYLIGRRYTAGSGRWQFGLIETALLSGDFSPYYLIPYPFFPLSVCKVFLTESRVGDPKDANLLYQLDACYNGERGFGYAALLIDELPITPAWNGPYRIGLQLGGGIERFLGRDDLALAGEYTAVSRYTFTYHEGYAAGDYWAGDGPLGHALGPDADLLKARLTRDFGTWLGWIELARERHGEGGFGDRWDPAAGQALEFLTGTVETTWMLGAGCEIGLGGGFTAGLELAVGRVSNLNHRLGIDGWDGTLALRLELVL
ncbi:MAG: hypothetical protein ACM3X6_11200 [Patescibacteria group bacterium]